MRLPIGQAVDQLLDGLGLVPHGLKGTGQLKLNLTHGATCSPPERPDAMTEASEVAGDPFGRYVSRPKTPRILAQSEPLSPAEVPTIDAAFNWLDPS